MKQIEMIEVESSNVEAIGYNKESKTLRVMFKSESVYDYENVPEYIYKGLKISRSIGSFFAKNIKSNYKYEKMDYSKIKKVEENEIIICNECKFPLLFTFVFPKKEYYCLNCGKQYRTLDNWEQAKTTKELEEKKRKAEKIFARLRSKIFIGGGYLGGCSECDKRESSHINHLTEKEKDDQEKALEELKEYAKNDTKL